MHRQERTVTFSSLVAVTLLVVTVGGFMTKAPAASGAPAQPVGIAIPLYTDPTDSSWASVIQAKQQFPNVPIIAIINPDNGPAKSSDPSYVTGIASMQAAGVLVIGYIDTHYGSTSTSSVETQVNDYHNWYKVNGIFFDEESNAASTEGYYSTVSGYVHSLGMSETFGNPGTSVPTGYIGTTDVICIYENPGLPSISSITYTGYSPSNFYVIAYGVSLNTSFVTSAAGLVSWIYLTDASGSNPYDVLPSYFTSEVALLSSIDGGSTTTTSTSATTQTSTSISGPPSGGTSSLHVNSVNSFGNSVDGYYTILYNSAGSSLATGFSPSVFTLSDGVGYQVEADSYSVCTFSHWSGGPLNGNSDDPATISVTGPTTVTAVYSGTSCGPQTTNSTTSTTTSVASTTTTSTPTSSTTESIASSGSTSTSITTSKSTSSTSSSTTTPSAPSVVVKSVNQNAKAITGYWAVLYSSSGSKIAAGYTTKTFTAVKAGTRYQVELNSYGSCTFTNWQGTTNSGKIAFTQPNGPLTLVGVYTCTSSGSMAGLLFAALSQVALPLGFVAAALASLGLARGARLVHKGWAGRGGARP